MLRFNVALPALPKKPQYSVAFWLFVPMNLAGKNAHSARTVLYKGMEDRKTQQFAILFLTDSSRVQAQVMLNNKTSVVLQGNASIMPGHYSHIVLTVDAHKARLFQNGIVACEEVLEQQPLFGGDSPLFVGKLPKQLKIGDKSYEGMDGFIDNLLFFPQLISLSEIHTLASVTPALPPVVATDEERASAASALRAAGTAAFSCVMASTLLLSDSSTEHTEEVMKMVSSELTDFCAAFNAAGNLSRTKLSQLDASAWEFVTTLYRIATSAHCQTAFASPHITRSLLDLMNHQSPPEVQMFCMRIFRCLISLADPKTLEGVDVCNTLTKYLGQLLLPTARSQHAVKDDSHMQPESATSTYGVVIVRLPGYMIHVCFGSQNFC